MNEEQKIIEQLKKTVAALEESLAAHIATSQKRDQEFEAQNRKIEKAIEDLSQRINRRQY